MDDNATISVAQPGTFDLQGDEEYSGSCSLFKLGIILSYNLIVLVWLIFNIMTNKKVLI